MHRRPGGRGHGAEADTLRLTISPEPLTDGTIHAPEEVIAPALRLIGITVTRRLARCPTVVAGPTASASQDTIA